jgi:carbon monoxide dehydrogenase subunit G
MRGKASAVIERPAEEVWAFVADPMQEHRWAPVVREVRKNSDGPVGVGYVYDETIRLLGRGYQITLEVTEYEPPRLMRVRITKGAPGVASGARIVERTEGGTRLTIETEGRSRIGFGLVEPLVNRVIARALRRALANVKRIVEQGGG